MSYYEFYNITRHLDVTPAGFKPATYRTGIWHSIQLSYGAKGH